ncbi:MAG TPA: oligosaccharide flippase family protein [Desulfobacteraceae bacterium]|nr:oligosaccharide flippase family protein [Desulfobacteraceae bacterium]HPQ27839.1 oligosaccharide flippase family protein [Desulfobacteraceae bacterium]
MFKSLSKASKAVQEAPFFETLNHSKNYLISSVAQEGLKFVSIPVFTYLLTVEDYGIINIFSSYVSIFVILLVFNLHGAVSRYYYEEKEDFNQFLGFSIALVGCIYSFSIAGFLIFQRHISSWIELPESVIPYFIPAVLMGIISSLFRQVYQPRKETKRIRRVSIAQTYVGFALAVGFILLQKDELYLGRLKGDVAVFIIFGFLRMRDVLRYTSFRFKFNKEHLKYILNFSLPNIPYLLSGIIIAQFGRIMLNNTNGSEEAGLYSFAYNIATLQIMISNSLHNAWTPNYYAYMNRTNYEVMDNESHLIIKLITLSAIILIMFANELGALLSPDSYHTALNAIPVIILGHFFLGILPFNKNAIQYSKKTYITAATTISAGILNIVLNALFIPKYGYIAAAYSTLASYAYLYIIETIISKYFLKYHIFSPGKLKIEFIVLGGVLILYYLLFSTSSVFSFQNLVLKLLIVGITVTILFWKKRKLVVSIFKT